MRILFCNYEYPPLGGGGGVSNALLAEELVAARGHDVTVLTSQGLSLPRVAQENGVRVIRVPVIFRAETSVANMRSMFLYIVQGLREGRRLLARESFDVINTHFVLPSGPVGDLLRRKSGVPNVLSLHGGDLYDPSKQSSPHRHYFLKVAVRRMLQRADRVVAQSRDTIENMQRFYRDDIPVTQIPLGIRRPPAGAGSRDSYGFHADDVLMITIGRLVSRKAVEQIIHAMPMLHHERARLLVVGSGPQEQHLREEAKRLDVAGRVHFLGHVAEDEKFRLLRMSDLYVSTSQHEGFGLVFLEAMACGLPVICYNRGGQSEFLADGVTGSLVPLNAIDRFIEGCRALARDTARRGRIGEANRERVEEYFIDRCAERYEQVFREVIDGR